MCKVISIGSIPAEEELIGRNISRHIGAILLNTVEHKAPNRKNHHAKKRDQKFLPRSQLSDL